MIKTLLIPGLNGSTDDHWQRHWARERPAAALVEQDDWACPVLEDWQERLDEALSDTDGAFLVAHSLGCLLVASYARRRLTPRIKGALLVAPCDLATTRRLHPCVVQFGNEPLDRLPFPSLVVGSLNDHYMSLEQLERHVASLGQRADDDRFRRPYQCCQRVRALAGWPRIPRPARARHRGDPSGFVLGGRCHIGRPRFGCLSLPKRPISRR
uniref:RBBP9/YdeN family alpha/beta hydrolase n=1 Tax=Neorhizobium sp. EC2-8 TaxID=3129230 RepID=UPI003100BAAE